MPKRLQHASIITRGAADPPATIPRGLDRSASGLFSVTRSTSFQTVGTPRENVGRSSRIILTIGSPCKNIWGMISSAPAKNAVYATPQALTWNIGTINRHRSRSLNPIEFDVVEAIECSHVERWE